VPHLTAVSTPSLLKVIFSARTSRVIWGITYRCVRLHWAVQLHGGTTFLDDLGVLPVETSFLVLLSSGDLLFEPTAVIELAIHMNCYDRCLPLFGTFILISIPSRCQTIGESCLFFNELASVHISAYDSRVTNNFGLPFIIDLRPEHYV
jgi:hypothetical protein